MSPMKALVALAILCGLSVPAYAADYDTYKKLTKESIADLSAGVPDPDAFIAKESQLMEIGIAAAKEHAAAYPDDAKIMDVLVSSAPAMKIMSPQQLEDAWGDKGTAGDAIGLHLKDMEQFSLVHDHIDAVVHPARAAAFVRGYKSNKDKSALQEAKGELVEVLVHIKKIEELGTKESMAK